MNLKSQITFVILFQVTLLIRQAIALKGNDAKITNTVRQYNYSRASMCELYRPPPINDRQSKALKFFQSKPYSWNL